jgi:ATP-binding protein involved in chromosome partitioning
VAPDGSNHEIFGSGGGEFLAHESGVPLLGKIPIEPAVAQGGDDGKPVALQLSHIDASAAPPSPAARAFGELARLVATEVSPRSKWLDAPALVRSTWRRCAFRARPSFSSPERARCLQSSGAAVSAS